LFYFIQKEVTAYFNSFVGYLVIGLYLLLSGYVFWVHPSTSILENGFAQLDGYFNTAPYLLCILIPAITMKSIAGERAEGTLDWLRTKPISMWSLIWGKLLGAWFVFLLAIIPTFIYVYTLSVLAQPAGSLDYSGIMGSYIGLMLLGGGLVSMGVFFSSITHQPALALLGSVLCGLLLVYGLEWMQLWGYGSGFWTWIESWTMGNAYQSLRRGVLDTRAIGYFLGIILFFACLGQKVLTFQGWKKSKSNGWSWMIISVIWIMYGASHGPFLRWDMTSDQRFSVSDISKAKLAKLSAPIQVHLLLAGELPSGFKRMRQATLDLLGDFKAYSGNKLHISTFNPLDLEASEQEQWMEALVHWGVQPMQLHLRTKEGTRQQLIFPVALVQRGDRTVVVDLLQNKQGLDPQESLNRSIQNLEYAFLSAIDQSLLDQKPLLGITEGHGELTDLDLQDAIQTLSQRYEVGRIRLDQISLEGIQQLAVLVIPRPQHAFSETEKYKIDHFIQHGGHVVWSIDQVDADLDSLRSNREAHFVSHVLRLEDQWFTYGFRFNADILADLQSMQIPLTAGQSGGQVQITLQPWPFHPYLLPASSHPLVKDLDPLAGHFVGSIDTVAVEGIRFTPLFRTSGQSRKLQAPLPIDMAYLEMYLDPLAYDQGPYTVAYLAEGIFPSVFYMRPAPAGIDRPMIMERSLQEAKMVVLSDGHIFKNHTHPEDHSAYPLGWSRYEEKQYGNRNFLLNLMDYLSGEEALLTLRTKEWPLRLLDGQRVWQEKRKWQWINVGVPLVLLLLGALLQQGYRKRKYAKNI
jgi:ABC-2 type transport system permease protein